MPPSDRPIDKAIIDHDLQRRHKDNRLYHRTQQAEAIMRDGFRGRSGSFMTSGHFEDVVWLSDDGHGEQETAGGRLIEIDVPPGTDLDFWEVVEEGSPWREWAVPAALLNAWPRRLL